MTDHPATTETVRVHVMLYLPRANHLPSMKEIPTVTVFQVIIPKCLGIDDNQNTTLSSPLTEDDKHHDCMSL